MALQEFIIFIFSMKVSRLSVSRVVEMFLSIHSLRQVGYSNGDGTGVKLTARGKRTKNARVSEAVICIGKLDFKNRNREKGIWKIEFKK